MTSPYQPPVEAAPVAYVPPTVESCTPPSIPTTTATPMTKREIAKALKTEMSLEEFEETALEAIGSKPGLTLKLKNGDVSRIPHPMLVDEDRQEAIELVQSREDLDPELDADGNAKPELDEKDNPIPGTVKRADTIGGVKAPSFSTRLAHAILGEDGYARFRAGGGNANHVILAWNYLSEGMQAGPKLES